MRFAVFGEILWDVFGGEKNIGGAPFNLAAHMSMLGADVDLISAVGDDELGRGALSECRKLGLGTEHVAITDYPTGRCQVSLKDGMPSYDLVRNMAYDHIPVPEENLEPDVFCFGTLAQRHADSSLTLETLLNGFKGREIFCDINIRQDFYSPKILKRSLSASTILKISREESGVFDLSGTSEEICARILGQYPGLRLIIMTLDSDGAFAMERTGEVTYSPAPTCNVVSTVGAGDSFSAGFLVSFLNGKGIKASLDNAVTLASFVCENVGAVCEYPEDLKSRLLR